MTSEKRIKPGSKQRSISLDPSAKVTLARQLYEQLRAMILSGDLAAGERLLSTRELSEIAGVSRPTVTGTYEELLQEGYLEARHGSGTYVSSQLPKLEPRSTSERSEALLNIQRRLSLLGLRLIEAELPQPGIPEVEIGFYSWRPAANDNQTEDWSKLWWRTARVTDRAALDYQSDPLGYEPLREAIARDLEKKRMIRCSADQIIMVASLPQALDLICRLHLDRGDRVATENPGYPQLREIAQLHGAEVVPISVDDGGIVIDELLAVSASGLKLLYTTPSHQCPTGAILTLPRRLALLEWAHRNRVVLIEDEDDFETDNCYEDRPLSALMGLDKYESVVYIGSFSKIVSPFAALTYLVVPNGLSTLYARARRLMGAQVPTAIQHCLAEIINQGLLKGQLRRMRELYDVRRKTLVEALTRHFGDQVSIGSANAGLYVLATFKTKLTSAEIIARAQMRGVGLVSTAHFYATPLTHAEFILGYGDLEEQQIQEGIRRLSGVLGVE